ncbi:MAG: hypothetical protein A3J46_04560 [Candidatus Yanofskybacteria bacterium RIFCSPHIGHO2_02_FULL_41_11]|uniref:Uncharacterized protein n=1 Tax=Candidatus Yanofskybacteria bacterium RIFCSPHIGHO2_02_FULL_41_11 TaxID=1802675 RepID=A0A1F8F7W2_9BACT|nr:MAG: hypothetical protein A3J46_04560 [Candidatus Yanofskybacteria bacterium RIFCSPHIGHO2_02_FULL_41_11]
MTQSIKYGIIVPISGGIRMPIWGWFFVCAAGCAALNTYIFVDKGYPFAAAAAVFTALSSIGIAVNGNRK